MARKRILFLLPTNVGDFILSTPVLRFFQEKIPHSIWDVIVGEGASNLIEKYPLIGNLYFPENFRGFRGKMSLYDRLREFRYYAVVDLRKTAFPFLLDTRRRYYRFRKARGHAVHEYFSILRKEHVKQFPGFFTVTTEADLLSVHRILKSRGIEPNSSFIGLNPDANWDRKRWEPEKWEELIRILKDRLPEVIFLVTGLKKRLRAMPDVCDLSGELNLRELAEVLKLCRLYISNDSGPMHLSVAVGTLTLGIFGPSLPERYAPYGMKNSYYKNQSLCKICLTTSCDKDFWCLKNTDPGEIAEIALEMVGK
ncbi:MAG: glycosyltransferase family 9 protein [Candidatus Wallbacteria bacterium]|nr:glycosyltransferase family 9 protein [Candidatus Wallbacteria bacterium]